MSASDCVVTLKGGVVVEVPVLRRVWALESRGIKFRLDAGDVLVGPSALLDDDDRAFLRGHKPALLTIIAYQPGEVTV